jgi:hypothetical protein
MAAANSPFDEKRHAQALADLGRDAALRRDGYRDRALKLFPHVCASCGREFSGKRLKELTVHHQDHNYKNNPPDGSNWILLCLYCHDHEHEKYKMAEHQRGVRREDYELAPSIFSPFENLDKLVCLDDAAAASDAPAADGAGAAAPADAATPAPGDPEPGHPPNRP